MVHGVVRGVPPALDLGAERALQTLLVELAADRLMRSAHDCSDGGLAVTLAECCFDTDGIGADVSIDRLAVARTESVNRAAALFGESASRVVVSAAPEAVSEVVRRASAAGVPSRIIGRTGGRSLRIAVGGELAVDVTLVDAERAWSDAVQRYFAKRVA
jgi:phosphoribosylformylglycinamidine synthase